MCGWDGSASGWDGSGVRQRRPQRAAGRSAGLALGGGAGVRQGYKRMGGGGGGGGCGFLWCFKTMKGCKKMKGPPLFFLENFRTSKIFAKGGEFSLLENFRYCSENVVPALVFLLHNKKNKKNKNIRLKLLKTILIKN